MEIKMSIQVGTLITDNSGISMNQINQIAFESKKPLLNPYAAKRLKFNENLDSAVKDIEKYEVCHSQNTMIEKCEIVSMLRAEIDTMRSIEPICSHDKFDSLYYNSIIIKAKATALIECGEAK
jgi:hypothetical protein